ncbi:amidohydrolase family protein [Chachezhania sediminis]|uniref:amidohydrolase family protein n=1 Tax=Chachezhania sediminis TaxID=2599291 RepID=UPI001E4C06F9|nr:amidohydrolase family protein [Chachezhania sediminis]
MTQLWQPGMERRDDWLAQVSEDIVDPEREIVDPHHHLWQRGGPGYMLEDLWADTDTGHNVVQTIYIECRSFYDEDAAPELQSVAETRTVAGICRASEEAPDKAHIAGIVAHADLSREDLPALLDAHLEAAGDYLVGFRHSGARDAEPENLYIPGRGYEGQYTDPAFQRGVQLLGERGLTYDTWHYHHQADDYLALARSAPETVMVLDHFSTPLGGGRFAGQRDAIFATWQKDMETLAKCPNVRAKLGGLAMPDNGWGWLEREVPVTSDEFVEAQGKWYTHMIDLFGPERCMFESNFPVDRTAISYPVLWNAFKKIAAAYPEEAQAQMCAGTARSVYGLPQPAG